MARKGKVGNGVSGTLSAHTTLRLEALKYEQELFPDDNPVTDRSGWRLLLGKSFDGGSVSASEISSFVDEVDSICRKSDDRFPGFDKAHVCATLFTKFRCTVDDCMLGFILKSKTVVEPLMPPQRKGFFLFRFIRWTWRGFKMMYNGLLESMKIG